MEELQYCQAPHCPNLCRPGRKLCHRCDKEKWRSNNPMMASYSNLKWNARRRGVGFKLTFEEFCQFCKDTRYLELRGLTAASMSIDRIDPLKGYEPGNIQLLSLSDNTKKAKKEKMAKWKRFIPKSAEDPF